MRIIRLYVNQKLTKDSVIRLDDASRHYAINVLRANKNTPLTLFNGDGYDYACELLTFTKKIIEVKVIDKIHVGKESLLTTKLLLGISKSSRMDYAIQKTVEAGVSSIHPLITERTVSKLSEKSKKNKIQHWQKIIISACEQCRRAVLPDLNEIIEFTQLQKLENDEYGFIFDTNSNLSLASFHHQTISSVFLLVGPEGGFTKSEVNDAKSKGYQPVSIGPRVLRTETAALSATISAQLLWGDLSELKKKQ